MEMRMRRMMTTISSRSPFNRPRRQERRLWDLLRRVKKKKKKSERLIKMRRSSQALKKATRTMGSCREVRWRMNWKVKRRSKVRVKTKRWH